MAPLGDVAHGRALLRTIREQGGRIGIHNGAVEEPQPLEQFGSELVVGSLQAVKRRGPKTPQEAPQGIAVREVRQPQQGRDEAIVDERLGILDPADAGHHSEDMRQEQIDGMVFPVRVVGPANVELEKVTQIQRFAELLKKGQATEPG